MPCPATESLIRFAHGRLDRSAHAAVAQHILDCPPCRGVAADYRTRPSQAHGLHGLLHGAFGIGLAILLLATLATTAMYYREMSSRTVAVKDTAAYIPASTARTAWKDRVTLTCPRLSGRDPWSMVEPWMRDPLQRGADVWLYPVRGVVAGAPEGAWVDLQVFTNQWWPQQGGPIDAADGSFAGSVWLRPFDRIPTVLRVSVVTEEESGRRREIGHHDFCLTP